MRNEAEGGGGDGVRADEVGRSGLRCFFVSLMDRPVGNVLPTKMLLCITHVPLPSSHAAGFGCTGRGCAGRSKHQATEGPLSVPPHVPPVQVSAALGEAERAAASAKQQRGLREAEVAAARAASSSGGTPSSGAPPSRTVSGGNTAGQ